MEEKRKERVSPNRRPQIVSFDVKKGRHQQEQEQEQLQQEQQEPQQPQPQPQFQHRPSHNPSQQYSTAGSEGFSAEGAIESSSTESANIINQMMLMRQVIHRLDTLEQSSKGQGELIKALLGELQIQRSEQQQNNNYAPQRRSFARIGPQGNIVGQQQQSTHGNALPKDLNRTRNPSLSTTPSNLGEDHPAPMCEKHFGNMATSVNPGGGMMGGHGEQQRNSPRQVALATRNATLPQQQQQQQQHGGGGGNPPIVSFSSSSTAQASSRLSAPEDSAAAAGGRPRSHSGESQSSSTISTVTGMTGKESFARLGIQARLPAKVDSLLSGYGSFNFLGRKKRDRPNAGYASNRQYPAAFGANQFADSVDLPSGNPAFVGSADSNSDLLGADGGTSMKRRAQIVGGGAGLEGNKLAKKKTATSRALANAKAYRRNPIDSRLVAFVDIVFILFSVALCVMVITFIHPKLEHIDATPHGGIIAFYVALYLVTWSWMVVRIRQPFQKDHWDIIDDPKELVKRYLRTWFGFDLICAVPIEFVFIAWANPIFYYSGTRHFLRLFRILTLGVSHNPLVQARQWLRFTFFCISLVLVIHCVACVFWAIEPRNYSYVQALYWAVATMSGIGYGDVVASDDDGRIYSIFAMICGITMLSAVTAFATSFLTSKDPIKAEEEQKMQMLNSMLQFYNIPWGLQKEVISMFPSVLNAHSEAQFRTLIEGLPPFLRRAVDGYIHARLLHTLPLLQDLEDAELLAQLSDRMSQRFFPAFEYIIRVGEAASEMYFLIRGVVDVLVGVPPHEISVAHLRSGSYFGEIALIQDTVRTASVLALTGCELVVLQKEDFCEILKSSERLQAEVEKRLADMRSGSHSAYSDDFQSRKHSNAPSVAPSTVLSDNTFNLGKLEEEFEMNCNPLSGTHGEENTSNNNGSGVASGAAYGAAAAAAAAPRGMTTSMATTTGISAIPDDSFEEPPPALFCEVPSARDLVNGEEMTEEEMRNRMKR